MARGASSHARRPSMPVSKRAVWPWSKRRSATAVRSSVAALPTWASDSPIVWALEPPVPTPITTRPGSTSRRVAMARGVTETWRGLHRHPARSRARPRRDRRGHRRLERPDDGAVAGPGRESGDARANGGRAASLAPGPNRALRDGHRGPPGVARRPTRHSDLPRGLGPADARDGRPAGRWGDRLRDGLARCPEGRAGARGRRRASGRARPGRPRHRPLGADVDRARPRAGARPRARPRGLGLPAPAARAPVGRGRGGDAPGAGVVRRLPARDGGGAPSHARHRPPGGPHGPRRHPGRRGRAGGAAARRGRARARDRVSAGAGGRVRGARADPDDVRGGGAAAGRIMEDVMRRAWIAATLALLLGGCASYAWVKPNVTAEVKAHDEATCRAEARNLTSQYAYGGFGAPFGYSTWRQPWTGPYSDLSWQVAAEEREYERCMRGRGYDLDRGDKKS